MTSYGDFMALAALSFICAQEEYSIVRNPPQEIYREVRANADQFQDSQSQRQDVLWSVRWRKLVTAGQRRRGADSGVWRSLFLLA